MARKLAMIKLRMMQLGVDLIVKELYQDFSVIILNHQNVKEFVETA